MRVSTASTTRTCDNLVVCDDGRVLQVKHIVDDEVFGEVIPLSPVSFDRAYGAALPFGPLGVSRRRVNSPVGPVIGVQTNFIWGKAVECLGFIVGVPCNVLEEG